MIVRLAPKVIMLFAPNEIARFAPKLIIIDRSFETQPFISAPALWRVLMANRRTSMHRLQELVRLHRMGTKTRAVAKLLGMSPNTERSYRKALEASGLLHGSPEDLPTLDVLEAALKQQRPRAKLGAHEVSSIADWAPRIQLLLEAGLTPGPIYDRLRQEEPSFQRELLGGTMFMSSYSGGKRG